MVRKELCGSSLPCLLSDLPKIELSSPNLEGEQVDM